MDRREYDSVDHRWLDQIFSLHHFPRCIGDAIWNIRIAVRTVNGLETPERMRFSKGLPQGEALFPRLCTLSINPLAWKLRATLKTY